MFQKGEKKKHESAGIVMCFFENPHHLWINAFAFPNPSAPHYPFLPPEASTSYVAVNHANMLIFSLCCKWATVHGVGKCMQENL